MNFVDQLYSDLPRVHRGETEMSRAVSRSESALDDAMWNSIPWNSTACYGVSRDLAEFLNEVVETGWHTAETGSGASTLIFAHRGARHTAVTPNREEATTLVSWAGDHGLDISRTTFVCKASEEYLPGCDLEDLDCVLLDGKHAFPWPIIDWFFTASRLKRGGLMILDDIDMASVGILVEFLRAETTRWELVKKFERSICFRKCVDSIDDVSWHMQPFVARHLRRQRPRGLKRIMLGIKRRLPKTG